MKSAKKKGSKTFLVCLIPLSAIDSPVLKEKSTLSVIVIHVKPARPQSNFKATLEQTKYWSSIISPVETF